MKMFLLPVAACLMTIVASAHGYSIPDVGQTVCKKGDSSGTAYRVTRVDSLQYVSAST